VDGDGETVAQAELAGRVEYLALPIGQIDHFPNVRPKESNRSLLAGRVDRIVDKILAIEQNLDPGLVVGREPNGVVWRPEQIDMVDHRELLETEAPRRFIEECEQLFFGLGQIALPDKLLEIVRLCHRNHDL
jgi:hypothetical protein